jgi:hypothetical protein
MRVNGGLIRERNVVTISWKAPMHGWVTLNTNGVCKGGILAEYRGIIRAKAMNGYVALVNFLGTCSTYIIELWEVLKGL